MSADDPRVDILAEALGAGFADSQHTRDETLVEARDLLARLDAADRRHAGNDLADNAESLSVIAGELRNLHTIDKRVGVLNEHANTVAAVARALWRHEVEHDPDRDHDQLVDLIQRTVHRLGLNDGPGAATVTEHMARTRLAEWLDRTRDRPTGGDERERLPGASDEEWPAHPPSTLDERLRLVGADPDLAAWQRDVLAEARAVVRRRVAATPTETATEHRYLSTGCLHDEHAYCQSMTGQQGEKRPATCKFCEAKCVCPCHLEAEQ